MDKTVLVVDDTAAVLKLSVDILSSEFKVAAAKSGEKAIAYVQKNIPDLILLDINMPDMNGFQTMEQLKKYIDVSEVPVLFLSGENGRQGECIACGGMDCVLKPFDARFIIHKVKAYTELAQYRKNAKRKGND